MINTSRAGQGELFRKVAVQKKNQFKYYEGELKALNCDHDVIDGFKNAILNGKLTKAQARAIAADTEAYKLYVKATAGRLGANPTIEDMIKAAGYTAGFDLSSDISPYYDTGYIKTVESDTLVPEGEVGLYDPTTGTVTLNKKAPLDKKLAYRLARELLRDIDTADPDFRLDGSGKLHFDGDMNTLTELQRGSIKALERLSDALGIDIYIETELGTNKNGWFDHSDNSIHISLDAGTDGRGTLLFTAAHELTHFIKKYSPEKWQSMTEFVIVKGFGPDVDVGKLMRDKQNLYKENGIELTNDQAEQEIVADACEQMLIDGSAFEALAELRKTDATLFERIKYFITNFVAKIRNLYKDIAPGSAEAKYISEMNGAAAELQQLFNDALVDATSMFNLNPSAETAVDVQYALKDIDSDIYYPKTQRERSAFNRSFANKTSHLKDGEIKNIIIRTADNVYLVVADGYYSGEIEEVFSISSEINNTIIQQKIKEFTNGTDKNGDEDSSLIESIRSGRRRNDVGSVTSSERGRNAGTDRVDENAYGRNGKRSDGSGAQDLSSKQDKQSSIRLAPVRSVSNGISGSLTNNILTYMRSHGYNMDSEYDRVAKKLNPYFIEHRSRVGSPLLSDNNLNHEIVADFLTKVFTDSATMEKLADNDLDLAVDLAERVKVFADTATDKQMKDFANDVCKNLLAVIKADERADALQETLHNRILSGLDSPLFYGSINGGIVNFDDDKKTLKERAIKFYNDFRRNVTDSGEAFDRLAKKLDNKTIYHRFDNTKQAAAATTYMLEKEQTDIEGNKIGKSLKEIFEPILEDDKKYHDFNVYMQHLNNAARDLNGKAILGKGTRQQSLDIAETLLKANPEFAEWEKDVRKYEDGLMRWRIDAELISEEDYEHMRELNPWYVPALRDNRKNGIQTRHLKNVVADNTIRAAVSDAWEEPLMPLFDVYTFKTAQVIKEARLNLLMLELFKTLKNKKLIVDTPKGIVVTDPALCEFVDQVTAVTDLKHGLARMEGGKYITVNTNNALVDKVTELFGIDIEKQSEKKRLIKKYVKELTLYEKIDDAAMSELVDKLLTKKQKGNTIKEKGADENGGTDTGELEAVRAGGDNNGIRKQSANSEKMDSLVGSHKDASVLTAGVSGWLSYNREERIDEKGSDFGLPGDVYGRSEIKISSVDSAGRHLSDKLQNELKNTVLKSENGTLLSLYHWTDEKFDRFSKGDIGFHFGTLDAASVRAGVKGNKRGKSIYKEAYVNLTHPLVIESDSAEWSIQFVIENTDVFSEDDIARIKEHDYRELVFGQYGCKTVDAFHQILKEKGYDGIIYENSVEGDLSVIAFYPDQIITVAENGTDIIDTSTYGYADKLAALSEKAVSDAKTERANIEKDTGNYMYAAYDPDNANNFNFSKNEHDGNRAVFYVDGIRHTMDIGTAVYEGLRSIRLEMEGEDFYKPLVWLNDQFKRNVTSRDIFFAVRNGFRDLGDAYINSSDAVRFTGYFLRAYKEITSNGEMWKLYQSLGGTGNSYFDFVDDIKAKAKGKKRSLPGKLVDGFEYANLLVEQAPRLAEFMMVLEKSRKKGDNSYAAKLEALHAANDITVNFGRSGMLGRRLNATIVPFLNPGIQGASRFIRIFTTKRSLLGWVFLCAKLLGFGFSAAWINDFINKILCDEDEYYDQLTDYQKYSNIILPIGDGKFAKFPMGRTVGMLAILSGTPGKAANGEIKSIEDVFGIITTAVDQIAPNNPLTENLASPIINAASNRTWYGSKIISEYEEKDLDPELRYDETTDYLSVWVGSILNISPKKIHYVLDSYSGVIGDFVLPLITPKTAGGNVLKTFMNSLTDDFVLDGITSNRISSEFYSLIDERGKETNREGDPTAALVSSRFMNSQAEAVKNLNKEIKEINSGKLSPKEKAEKSREVKATINGIMLNAMASEQEVYAAAKNIKSKYAYEKDGTYYNEIGEELTEKAYIDIIYREVNREVFGAEYALQTYDDDTYKNAAEAVNNGATYDLYYDAYFGTKNIEGDYDTDKGRDKTGTARLNKWAEVNKLDASRSEKVALARTLLKIDDEKIKEAQDSEVDLYDYINFLCDTGVMSSGVNLTKKDKVLSYINRMQISRKEKDAFYLLAGYSEKTLSDAPWR